MIEIHYGRYSPTTKISDKDLQFKNIFRSEIYQIEELELTEAVVKGKNWLEHHMGFVLLYHNGILIQRMCNYRLFKDMFMKLNIIVELENYIRG